MARLIHIPFFLLPRSCSVMREVTGPPDLLGRLRPKERRGSKPRCHRLTSGTEEEVARRLTSFIHPLGRVSAFDKWMPIGFEATEEAQLHRAGRLIESPSDRDALKNWWLADPRPSSRTPTWDIASTCTIDGRRGLALMEAKAHEAELINETCGKRFDKGSSEANHCRIGRAIAEANEGLRLATKTDWHLSSAHCYQMSNRFAWAWKLCSLGYPIALAYLGFIGATEIPETTPFRRDIDWHESVKAHSARLFPFHIWDRGISIAGVTLLPLIRTCSQTLE
jgi:hypothetical protein